MNSSTASSFIDRNQHAITHAMKHGLSISRLNIEFNKKIQKENKKKENENENERKTLGKPTCERN